MTRPSAQDIIDIVNESLEIQSKDFKKRRDVSLYEFEEAVLDAIDCCFPGRLEKMHLSFQETFKGKTRCLSEEWPVIDGWIVETPFPHTWTVRMETLESRKKHILEDQGQRNPEAVIEDFQVHMARWSQDAIYPSNPMVGFIDILSAHCVSITLAQSTACAKSVARAARM